jgi:hypothetical protein
MLKDMLPQRWFGFDCFHLVVSNILLYKKFKDFKTVWKQCGTLYIKSKGNQQLGNLCSDYISRLSELKWLHNINHIESSLKSKEELIEEICQLIDQGEPVIIPVNTYYFEPNPHYQSRELYHSVTLVDYKKDMFTVVDHAYMFKGKLSIEQLLKASNIRNSVDGHSQGLYEYSYITIGDEYNLSEEDYLKVIKINNMIQKGSTNFGEILNICQDPEEDQDHIKKTNLEEFQVIIGIEAVNEFIKEFKHLHKNNDLLKDNLYSIYNRLLSISNKHYLFSIFLEEADTYFPDLDKVIKLHKEAAQDWLVASNMVLKGMFRNEMDMLSRMIEKVSSVYQKEITLSEQTDKIIS